MPVGNASAAEVARRLADALELAGIEYAIGGALAVGQYGVPRATNDIDVNVFVDALAEPQLVMALKAAGCVFDVSEARFALARGGDFGAHLDGYRVDIFPMSMELHASARDRVVRRSFLGKPACFLAAEDIFLFKLLWHRKIDIVDLERMTVVYGDRLDRAYLNEWIQRLFATDDPRRATYEALASDAPG